MAWGIWLAQNHCIFKEKCLQLYVRPKGLACLIFPRSSDQESHRQVFKERIDQPIPWAFVDGAFQGNPAVCRGEDILFSTSSHFFKFRPGLGPGTNNFAELISLKLLLLLAVEKAINSLYFAGICGLSKCY